MIAEYKRCGMRNATYSKAFALKSGRRFGIAVFLFLFPLLLMGESSLAREAETKTALPEGFIHVAGVIPDVVLDIRYYGSNNFVGRPIDGYYAPAAILSREAALALKQASEALKKQGYGIKIYDAYRPASAVAHFVRWANDPADTLAKAAFYPELEKKHLFKLGYISSRSGHSRGSTVDLTLVELPGGREVDMGSPFDFFSPISHPSSTLVTPEQRANRRLLQKAMLDAGFRGLSTEWWHFTLKKEPFPDKYFDFPVSY